MNHPLIQTMRPPFLILTIVCVILPASYLGYVSQSFEFTSLIPVLIGALFAHISVNTLNEYQDYTSGLDLNTRKTPFSGGSGALPEHPEYAPAVLKLAIGSLMLVTVIGLYFIFTTGLSILPIGIAGLLVIITYTRWLNRSALACLIAPGLGFGAFMISGTIIILNGQFLDASLPLIACVFFQVNNLLLLNQVPDIEADREAGRRHGPVRYGIPFVRIVYPLFSLLAYLAIGLGVYTGLLPMLSLIAMLTLVSNSTAYYGLMKHGKDIGMYPQFLAANVITTLVTPTLLAASLYLS